MLDPAALLSEVHRVLKPGGKAAFSVFGRAELNQKLGVVGLVLRSMGLADTCGMRVSCHLGDVAPLRARIQAAGLTPLATTQLVHACNYCTATRLTCTQASPSPLTDGSSIVPSVVGLIMSSSTYQTMTPVCITSHHITSQRI